MYVNMHQNKHSIAMASSSDFFQFEQYHAMHSWRYFLTSELFPADACRVKLVSPAPNTWRKFVRFWGLFGERSNMWKGVELDNII